jgi:hypothetical protein
MTNAEFVFGLLLPSLWLGVWWCCRHRLPAAVAEVDEGRHARMGADVEHPGGRP